MEFFETIIFYALAIFISVFSVMTVSTRHILRSATYLLFVLFGTAGIYFLLGYTFLGSVQIMVYAYFFARMAKIALEKQDSGDKFYTAKLATARFYFAKLVPEVETAMITAKAGLKPLMEMDEALF